MFKSNTRAAIEAVRDKDADKLNKILGKAKLKEMNTKDKDGYTPLMAAAESGNIAAVKTLVAAGVDVNAPEDSPRPLHLAVKGAYRDIIEVLLHSGADPKIKSPDGSTVMSIAQTSDAVAAGMIAPFLFDEIKPIIAFVGEKDWAKVFTHATALATSTKDNALAIATCGVLIKACSQKDPLPAETVATIDRKLVGKYIDRLEQTSADAEGGQDLISALVRAVCGLNRVSGQAIIAGTAEKNNVLRALYKNPSWAGTFGTSLISEFNRTRGSVRIAPLIQLLKDMFTEPTTAKWLYTNDLFVVIDVILRELADLPITDKLRPFYLVLLKLIIANTQYQDSNYKAADILTLLRTLGTSKETDKSSKTVIRNIMQEHGLALGKGLKADVAGGQGTTGGAHDDKAAFARKKSPGKRRSLPRMDKFMDSVSKKVSDLGTMGDQDPAGDGNGAEDDEWD